jgi:chemotaxis protein methyltransferase CheR
MPRLPMSPQVFSILSAVVSEGAGLHFDVSHAPTFAEKVGARAVEAGFESLLDYYYFLRYDADGRPELDRLVEALVVGETYFFRELPPLELAVDAFVAPLVAAGARPRLWCAAAATGEEPHTVAMLLAARGLLDRVDFVASDISAAALTRARSGRFSRRALRTEVPDFASPWLELADERGAVTVRPGLTEAIDWKQVNLVDDATVKALGTFDVVFCRNVLIYFDDDTVRQVVNRLSARLRPNGALFVGISESLLRFGTPLRCEEQRGIFLYKPSP